MFLGESSNLAYTDDSISFFLAVSHLMLRFYFSCMLFKAENITNYVQLEYLDVTDLRRGVGEVRVVVRRAPAC
jgi:hypothetical protein